MKALSVRQPWAWLIAHAGKTIENRTRAWSYRGPVAIHVPARVDWDAFGDPLVHAALVGRRIENHPGWCTSAIIGIADLTDAHHEHGRCCQPWGEPGAVHLVLTNIRPIPAIPCRGRLGLWTPVPPILDQLARYDTQASHVADARAGGDAS